MDIRIGCSGYQYKEWKGHFYPQDLPQSKWLQFYAGQFNSVEINSSFYRFPKADTLEKWYAEVPDGFKFSLKAPRFITHYHKFIDTKRMVADFYELADILKEKLGCILFQLPENLSFKEELLDRMIEQLDPSYKNVIEFRHPSFWQEKVYQALKEANISFCHLSGPIKFPKNSKPFTLSLSKGHPEPVEGIDELFYLRFHGSESWYCGSHANELKAWFNRVKASQAKEAWIYFNNTASFDAIHDAIKLKKLFESGE